MSSMMSGRERFPFVTTYVGANPKSNHLMIGIDERVEQIDSHAPVETSQMMGSKTICPRIANRISWRNARIYKGRRNRESIPSRGPCCEMLVRQVARCWCLCVSALLVGKYFKKWASLLQTVKQVSQNNTHHNTQKTIDDVFRNGVSSRQNCLSGNNQPTKVETYSPRKVAERIDSEKASYGVECNKRIQVPMTKSSQRITYAMAAMRRMSIWQENTTINPRWGDVFEQHQQASG
eukprot:scaffold535_cov42-Cyclotella_meneghiniana.AAC.3